MGSNNVDLTQKLWKTLLNSELHSYLYVCTNSCNKFVWSRSW